MIVNSDGLNENRSEVSDSDMPHFPDDIEAFAFQGYLGATGIEIDLETARLLLAENEDVDEK